MLFLFFFTKVYSCRFVLVTMSLCLSSSRALAVSVIATPYLPLSVFVLLLVRWMDGE